MQRGTWLKGGWNEWMEIIFPIFFHFIRRMSLIKKSHFKWNIHQKSLNGIMECAIQCWTSYFECFVSRSLTIIRLFIRLFYFQFVIKSAPFIVARVSLPKVLWTKGWKINSARENYTSEYNNKLNCSNFSLTKFERDFQSDIKVKLKDFSWKFDYSFGSFWL